MKYFVVALVAFFCTGNCLVESVSAKQDLESADVVSGVVANVDAMSVYPPHGVITNQQQFETVWNAWRRGQSVPKVDWQTEWVLVGIVRGPQGPLGTELELSGNGDLNFLVTCEQKGNVGFGYGFARVSKMGVRSINGKPIQQLNLGPSNQNKPGATRNADSIKLEVTGKLETGVSAIGGETTGIVVHSNNIVLELDVGNNADAQRAADKLNGEKVLVTGQLTRKNGVEVPDRWIVLVDSLAKSDGKKKKPMPKDVFKQIKVRTTGGIAGLDDQLTVSRDGKVSLARRNQDKTEYEIGPERLQQVRELIKATDWSKLKKRDRDPRIVDGMKFEFDVHTAKRKYSFIRDDRSLMNDEVLSKLHQLIKK